MGGFQALLLASGAKVCAQDLASVASCCLPWPPLVFCGPPWSPVVSRGLSWFPFAFSVFVVHLLIVVFFSAARMFCVGLHCCHSPNVVWALDHITLISIS